MANRTPKPTAKEKALATVAQAPSKPIIQSMTLAQAGLDDSESLDFYKAADWFESDEDVYSKPFFISKANLSKKSQYGNKLILTLAQDTVDGERSLVSLPMDDMRARYVAHFKANTVPVGPCVFKRLDVGKGQPYFAIANASEAIEGETVDIEEDEEVPF